jgi:flavin-dependent dehydrogenase
MIAADTSCLDQVASDGRVAVGDAAAAIDPLSSQGVYRALVSGKEAAAAIDAHLRGELEALIAYAHRVAMDFALDLHDRANYYRYEGRWLDSPFWKRRHLNQ